MTPYQMQIFQEIRRALDDLHTFWSENDTDGSHKSSEGYMEVYYPNWFEAEDDGSYAACEANGLCIYSYLFGPYRSHHFFRATKKYVRDSNSYSPDPFATALETVKKWDRQYRADLERGDD